MAVAGALTAGFAAVARAVRRGVRTGSSLWPLYVVVYAVGLVHVLEVNLVDAQAGAWVRAATGWDFATLTAWERPLHEVLARQPEPRVAAVTVYYLVGYIALLATTPHLVALTGDANLLRRVLWSYPVLYAMALPFYLFWPQENPYIALGQPSPLAAVDPGLERAYYWLTTPDNTFPSLHVAFTAVLTWYLVRSRIEALRGAFLVHGAGLVVSVVYVRVHWVTDVVAGLAAAAMTVAIVEHAVGPTRS